MKTGEIVAQLVKYINAGENVKAEKELYAEDSISIEQDGSTVKGLAGIVAKTENMGKYFEAFYGAKVTTAFIGADSFLIEITLDAQRKGGERETSKEWGHYFVKDGKISAEYFFMMPTSL